MRPVLAILIFILTWAPFTAQAASNYEYQLYKNHENFGIVVFPKALIFKGLEDYIASIPFESVESGKAVMRKGSKDENATYMMPRDVQKKHSIEKFIVIQVLDFESVLVGIYDPEWGLTLPSTIYQMDSLRMNIPKTLNVFRSNNPRRQTRFIPENNSLQVSFFSKPEYNIILDER